MRERAASTTSWRVQPVVMWMGAGIGALAAAAVLLWVHYGSAVFFEMITAGLAFCF